MYSCVYRILRLVPDPLAGECVNVGLLVMIRSRLHVRFTADWERVERFLGGPTDDLQELAMVLAEWDRRVTPLRLLLAADPVRELAGISDPRLQLSRVQSVDLPAGEAAELLAARFLRRPQSQSSGAAA